MNTVGKNHGNKLRDTGEKQIGMEKFIIASFATVQAKAVLKMVDAFLQDSSDFVVVYSILSPPNGARISAEVFFGIDIDHSSA